MAEFFVHEGRFKSIGRFLKAARKVSAIMLDVRQFGCHLSSIDIKDLLFDSSNELIGIRAPVPSPLQFKLEPFCDAQEQRIRNKDVPALGRLLSEMKPESYTELDLLIDMCVDENEDSRIDLEGVCDWIEDCEVVDDDVEEEAFSKLDVFAEVIEVGTLEKQYEPLEDDDDDADSVDSFRPPPVAPPSGLTAFLKTNNVSEEEPSRRSASVSPSAARRRKLAPLSPATRTKFRKQFSNESIESNEESQIVFPPPSTSTCVAFFKDQRRLTPAMTDSLLERAMRVLRAEDNVLSIDSDSEDVVVFGDLHGQYFDAVRVVERVLKSRPNGVKLLFLGDYVDRGAWSCEVLFYVLSLKIQSPDKVFLVRGNHETDAVSSYFGFKEECTRKYGSLVFNKCLRVFQCIPVCAEIDKTLFCCHGGISPNVSSVEEIRGMNRFSDPGMNGLFCDLLWSDPIKDDPISKDSIVEDFLPNPARGCSYRFSERAVESFLKKNGYVGMLRAHEVVENGCNFHWMHGVKTPLVTTVFSAPNYCGRYGNSGAYVVYSTKPNVLEEEIGRRAGLLLAVSFQEDADAPEPVVFESEEMKTHARMERAIPYMPTTLSGFVSRAMDMMPAEALEQTLMSDASDEDLPRNVVSRADSERRAEDNESPFDFFERMDAANSPVPTKMSSPLRRPLSRSISAPPVISRNALKPWKPNLFAFHVLGGKLAPLQCDLTGFRVCGGRMEGEASVVEGLPKILNEPDLRYFKHLGGLTLDGSTPTTSDNSTPTTPSSTIDFTPQRSVKKSLKDRLLKTPPDSAKQFKSAKQWDAVNESHPTKIKLKIASAELQLKMNHIVTRGTQSARKPFKKVSKLLLDESLVDSPCSAPPLSFDDAAPDVVENELNETIESTSSTRTPPPKRVPYQTARRRSSSFAPGDDDNATRSKDVGILRSMFDSSVLNETSSPITSKPNSPTKTKMSYVADFEDVELHHLQILFLMLDKDGSGLISANELKAWSEEESDFYLSEKQAQKCVSAVDADADGEIGLADFLWFASVCKQNYLKEQFQRNRLRFEKPSGAN